VAGVEGPGQPLGERGDVDGGAEVAGEPLLAGAEAQEAAQGDKLEGAGRDGQRTPRSLRASTQPGEAALVGAQDVAVDPGDAPDVGVLGELGERVEVAPVLGDGTLGGVAVELEPAEVFVDGLGEGDAGHGARTLYQLHKVPL